MNVLQLKKNFLNAAANLMCLNPTDDYKKCLYFQNL